LLKGPAVSGAQSYQGLCLAAKIEEKRQAELWKRILYRKGDSGTPVKKSFGTPTPVGEKENLQRSRSVSTAVVQITYFEIAKSQRRRVVIG